MFDSVGPDIPCPFPCVPEHAHVSELHVGFKVYAANLFRFHRIISAFSCSSPATVPITTARGSLGGRYPPTVVVRIPTESTRTPTSLFWQFDPFISSFAPQYNLKACDVEETKEINFNCEAELKFPPHKEFVPRTTAPSIDADSYLDTKSDVEWRGDVKGSQVFYWNTCPTQKFETKIIGV